MKDGNFFKDLSAELNVSNDINAKIIFKRMFTDLAFKEAHAYISEEQSVLEELIRNTYQTCRMNFCIVGGGPFHYLPLASQYFNKYILIEPYLRHLVDEYSIKAKKKLTNIECIEKRFEDYCRDFSTPSFSTKTLYVFWFNVIAYIQNPIECLNRIIKTGDTVFISRWGNSEKSQKTLEDYLNHVNSGKKKNAHRSLQVAQSLPLDQLCCTSKLKFVRQNITDIVIAHI